MMGQDARSCCDVQGGQVGDAFFAALERVRGIHANCRALLAGAHQRAGLELMDAMAAHQEAAYEALCRCPPLSPLNPKKP